MTQRIAVIGSGLLASQIAAQAIRHNFLVTVYNHRNDFTTFDRYLAWIGGEYTKFFDSFDAASFRTNCAAIDRTGDLAEAVSGADIVIESAVEDVETKQRLFVEIERHAAPDALLLTNSSTFLPAEIAAQMNAGDRLVSMHFANLIWRFNIAVDGGGDLRPCHHVCRGPGDGAGRDPQTTAGLHPKLPAHSFHGRGAVAARARTR